MSLRAHISRQRRGTLTFAALLLAAATTVAAAAKPSTQATPQTVSPRLIASLALDRPLTFNVHEERLEDVISFLEQLADCSLAVHWDDDLATDGMNREALISLSASNLSLRLVLERISEQADAQQHRGDTSTWQLTDDGRLEIGPRSRLNGHKRIEVYYIGDLTSTTPDFPQSAIIDLQASLAASQGSGSQPTLTAPSDEPSALTTDASPNDQLIETIIQTIEPDQWNRHAGDGARIHPYNDWLIINAPGYIHRQLVGIQP